MFISQDWHSLSRNEFQHGLEGRNPEEMEGMCETWKFRCSMIPTLPCSHVPRDLQNDKPESAYCWCWQLFSCFTSHWHMENLQYYFQSEGRGIRCEGRENTLSILSYSLISYNLIWSEDYLHTVYFYSHWFWYDSMHISYTRDTFELRIKQFIGMFSKRTQVIWKFLSLKSTAVTLNQSFNLILLLEEQKRKLHASPNRLFSRLTDFYQRCLNIKVKWWKVATSPCKAASPTVKDCIHPEGETPKNQTEQQAVWKGSMRVWAHMVWKHFSWLSLHFSWLSLHFSWRSWTEVRETATCHGLLT